MRVPFRPPHQIERDLRRISGVSLVWQTEDVDRGACDDEDEALPSYSEWQSYHVFFVSPAGDEFRFEDETIGEDPGDGTETAFSGEGRFGISLTISLAAPVAAIGVSTIRTTKTADIRFRIQCRRST